MPKSSAATTVINGTRVFQLETGKSGQDIRLAADFLRQQRDPRQLAAGGALVQRQDVGATMRGESELDGVDSVVLACGGVPNGELFSQLRGRHASVHVLGDAFAPRRVIHGVKQAYALVSALS